MNYNIDERYEIMREGIKRRNMEDIDDLTDEIADIFL
jgi:hypothetical protein